MYVMWYLQLAMGDEVRKIAYVNCPSVGTSKKLLRGYDQYDIHVITYSYDPY